MAPHQTIANPKVWNNKNIYWSMVASDLVQGIISIVSDASFTENVHITIFNTM